VFILHVWQVYNIVEKQLAGSLGRNTGYTFIRTVNNYFPEFANF
jgi:hypothetical protein